jgi:hypothetical protein
MLDGGFRLKRKSVRRAAAAIGVAVGIAMILIGVWVIRSSWPLFPTISIGALAWGLLLLSCSSWAAIREIWKRTVSAIDM